MKIPSILNLQQMPRTTIPQEKFKPGNDKNENNIKQEEETELKEEDLKKISNI